MNPFNVDFGQVNPSLDISRSEFNRNFSHKTTFNQGELVPIFIDEVLPGDTFTLDMTSLVRMTTPVFPVMDNANLDVYFFYCPLRPLWVHFKEFMGENTSSPWSQTTEYSIPQMKIGQGTTGITHNRLASYFGLPYLKNDGVRDVTVNALPFRAYYMIWNEWFRDQNTQYPINIYTGDATVNYGSDLTSGYKFGVDLLPVQRYADYFSTCLPGPQKGEAVLLPLGDRAPVHPYLEEHSFGSSANMTWRDGYGSLVEGDHAVGLHNSQLTEFTEAPSGVSHNAIYPTNLYADLSVATASTVNQLREAFAVQRLYERDARAGSRYREIVRSHFGVTIPDSRVQIPEYLGGFRQPINVQQVVQTSSSDNISPQGNTSAYSLTTCNNSIFNKSFVEHGFVIGLACVRVEHSYSQGIEKMWTRKRRFDFYDPALANLGNTPVMKHELCATRENMNDNSVFGYQEIWSEYRYKPNRVSGLFRPDNAPPSLQSWTYTDYYTSVPSLSDGWMREGKTNVNQTLAVLDEDQFLADFYFNLKSVRPMPMYSVPGLIDHH